MLAGISCRGRGFSQTFLVNAQHQADRQSLLCLSLTSTKSSDAVGFQAGRTWILVLRCATYKATYSVALGGLVVNVFVIGLKFAASHPAEDAGFLT